MKIDEAEPSMSRITIIPSCGHSMALWALFFLSHLSISFVSLLVGTFRERQSSDEGGIEDAENNEVNEDDDDDDDDDDDEDDEDGDEEHNSDLQHDLGESDQSFQRHRGELKTVHVHADACLRACTLMRARACT